MRERIEFRAHQWSPSLSAAVLVGVAYLFKQLWVLWIAGSLIALSTAFVVMHLPSYWVALRYARQRIRQWREAINTNEPEECPWCDMPWLDEEEEE